MIQYLVEYSETSVMDCGYVYAMYMPLDGDVMRTIDAREGMEVDIDALLYEEVDVDWEKEGF